MDLGRILEINFVIYVQSPGEFKKLVWRPLSNLYLIIWLIWIFDKVFPIHAVISTCL